MQDVVASRLEGAFVVVHLNRFQQIAAVYTLLAQSEQVKVRALRGHRRNGAVGELWAVKLKGMGDGLWNSDTLSTGVCRARSHEVFALNRK